ncbi:MAG: hypothetical protein RLN81_14720 [Balneolaceae bacterium]
MKNLKYLNLLILIVLVCCSDHRINELSIQDLEQIKRINYEYVEGWLENDSSKILNLYLDSATISPSGLQPKRGKKEITDFWFPDDSSTTTIHFYDLETLDIYGANDLAYTYEKGHLSFTYQKDDFVLNRESKSYATTIYRKTETGEWKVQYRMWTDMK